MIVPKMIIKAIFPRSTVAGSSLGVGVGVASVVRLPVVEFMVNTLLVILSESVTLA